MPEHGRPAADAVVADIAAFGHLFRFGHLGHIAGAAKIALLKRPGDEIELGGLFEKFAADFNPQFRVPEKGLIIDRHAAVGRQNLAVAGQHEGVNFQRPAVHLLEGFEKLENDIGNRPSVLPFTPIEETMFKVS